MQGYSADFRKKIEPRPAERHNLQAGLQHDISVTPSRDPLVKNGRERMEKSLEGVLGDPYA